MSDNLPRSPDWEEQLRKYFNLRIYRLLKLVEQEDNPNMIRLSRLIDEQSDLIEELHTVSEMKDEIIQELQNNAEALEAKVAWLEGNSHD